MKPGTVLGNTHRCVCLYVICLCMYRGVCACVVTPVAGQSRRVSSSGRDLGPYSQNLPLFCPLSDHGR